MIQNSATLSFSVDGDGFNVVSNIDRSIVAQLLDVKVSWMDTSSVIVHKGEKKNVLTYKIVNNGNGKDKYTMLAEDVNNKSKFDLARKRVYLDTNQNYQFDSDDRERKTVELAGDSQTMAFVVSDIDSDINVTSGSQHFINFRAISRIGGSGEKGQVHKGRGENGVDAIDGFSGGIDEAEGDYKLLIANTVINKEVTSKDEIITVTLTITVTGEGTVRDVNILDYIPDETIYQSGTLTLDGTSMSDQDDGDQGRYIRKSSKNSARILMSLGELDTSSHHIITYNLKMR